MSGARPVPAPAPGPSGLHSRAAHESCKVHPRTGRRGAHMRRRTTRPRAEDRDEELNVRTNLGRWERIGSVAAGAGLIYMARRQPRMGRGSQVLGAGLVARGVTGTCVVKRALTGAGRDRHDTRHQLGGPAGIHVRESIIVSRPADEVYRFWRDYGNLARFLEFVERVDDLGDGRSHWVVRGPGGASYEWDAVTVTTTCRCSPGRDSAWRCRTRSPKRTRQPTSSRRRPTRNARWP